MFRWARLKFDEKGKQIQFLRDKGGKQADVSTDPEDQAHSRPDVDKILLKTYNEPNTTYQPFHIFH